ncbi:hypothetical protein M0805_002091 [Coniferiporia weirii]|nr:hypothetical protein M0805_002091 [Coniferiporia weirii]
MAPIDHHRNGNSKGAKKALSIAVGYSNSELVKLDPNLKLPNTHKDPPKLRDLLIEKYGYKADDIRILMDDGHHESPTREAMINAMKELVLDAKAGDHFVFHFSGHGSQVKNEDGTEEDGWDEVIWPVDVVYDPNAKENEMASNYIIDDILKEILVDSLPPGTHLTAVLDSCHSGTAMDLFYHHTDDSHDSLWASPVSSPISPSDGPMFAEARSMSIDTVVETGIPAKAGLTKRGPRGPRVTKGMKLPHRARGHTVSIKEGDGPTETNIVTLNEGAKRPRPDYQKHVTSWSACLDEQIGIETNTGGFLTQANSVAFTTIAMITHAFSAQALVSLLGEDHVRTNKELLSALSVRLFDMAKEAKHSWREDKEFEELARTFPLPKPCLGSIIPTEEILAKSFTF